MQKCEVKNSKNNPQRNGEETTQDQTRKPQNDAMKCISNHIAILCYYISDLLICISILLYMRFANYLETTYILLRFIFVAFIERQIPHLYLSPKY